MTKGEGDRSVPTVIGIRRVGDAVALLLPPEVIARLDLKGDDTLRAVAHPDGGLTLTANDQIHARGVDLAR